MPNKPQQSADNYTDEETERRATEALHRALTTPYQPQKTVAAKAKEARKRKAKGSPKSA
ncbi:MAG TPA: hypothetical protein VNF99_19470 [Stellaceae bacterium]|nr:hypothetical protein [Stellaceae bacterium]